MKRRIRKGDALLLAAILLAGLAFGGWWMLNSSNGAYSSANGLLVICQTEDGFRRVDPLALDTGYTVETPGSGTGDDARGGVNTVRIAAGRVDVESANCGNQVCVEHQPISRAGEQIVCLPHGLVIEVVREESEATVLH